MRKLIIVLLATLTACSEPQNCDEDPTQAWIQSEAPRMEVPPPTVQKQILFYSNCAEIVDYALENQELISRYSYNRGSSSQQCNGESRDATTIAAPTQEDSISGNSGQPTNTQESHVDEADWVKVSHRYIFYTRENAVAVMDRETKTFVQSIPVLGHWRPHIFVFNETLAVIRPYEKPFLENEDKNKKAKDDSRPVFISSPERFEVVFYDLRNEIKEVGNKVIAGYYNSSRLSQDGLLTIITNISLAPHHDRKRNVNHIESLLSHVDCSQVAKPGVSDLDHNLTSVNSFNLANLKPGEAHKQTHLVGNYETVYQNKDLYLTKPRLRWFWWDDRGTISRNSSFTLRLVEKNDKWNVHSRLELTGQVLGSWSFKEKENHLFVATTNNASSRTGQMTNHLEVFKKTETDTLKVASLQGIAPGETLQSARFTDDYAYLVTFLVVDPLFVIDIRNPENPKLVSELKVPGYSSYLHDTKDGRLIGVGYQSWALQLSLFDVLDPEYPKTLDQKVIGMSSSSTAQSDHHAFFYNQDWQLMGLPVKSHTYSQDWAETFFETGAFFYDLSNNRLDSVGKVSHGDWVQSLCPVYAVEGGARSWIRLPGDKDVTRVLRIDDELMTFSDFGVRVHNPENPREELQRTLFNEPEDSCPKPYAVCTTIGG